MTMKFSNFKYFIMSSMCCLLFCTVANAQTAKKAISGIVLDSKQEPVIGATVSVKGTTIGTMTNTDGQFSLEAPSTGVLIVSYIGYSKQEISISGSNTYRFILKEDALDLDEVVVIGYGTAKKRDLTGSISSVKADKLQTEMPRSMQDLLRSNVAGLEVGISGRAKGSGDMTIRGKNNLRGKNEPLIVVDGVIYDGVLSDLNTNDIASVDVLKDASSAAVYGAKAANGIIAIMTRKGSDIGKPVINFNANWGWVSLANRRKVLSPEGYINFRQDYENGRYSDDYYQKYPQMFSDPRSLQGVNQLDWYNYDMKTPVTSVDETQLLTKWLSRLDFKTPEIENYLGGRTTNWQDAVFQTGMQQDYSASISNRSENVSYYWSLGYQDRESIYVGDKYVNYTSRLNLESKINKYLTVGVNMNFSSRDEPNQKWNSSDSRFDPTVDWGQSRNLSPYTLNEIDDPNSIYRRYPSGDNSSTNPFYDASYMDTKLQRTSLSGTIFGKLTLPYGFGYQVNFTPYISWQEYYEHRSSKHEGWAKEGGSAERRHEKWYNWQVDNLFTWKQEFNKKHNVEVTFLVNAEKGQYWQTKSQASQFSPNDYLGYHAMNAGAIPKASSNDTRRTGDALMGRLFYSYMNKYMLTTSVRRDGYSAFGLKNPHATFPAVALGWVFTSEKLGEKLNPWMTYGKLRLSWGQNGNRDIGQYEQIAELTPGLTPYIDGNGNIYLTSQLWVSRMANPDLKWENTKAYNLGFDFSLFNDILGGSIDVYKKETNDLLVERGLPKFTGFDRITTNIGLVENKGFELSLNSNILKRENLEWSVTGNFSINRRKLKKLYGDMIDLVDENGKVIGKQEANDTKNKWFIGQDPDRHWGYVRDGVWQLDEKDEAAKYGCAPGDFKYLDLDGDGIMTDKDKTHQKYTTPRFRWQIRNDFRIYKNFDFSFMIYSLWGHYGTFNDASNNVFADRVSNYDYPRWTPDNPINDYARIGSKNLGDNLVERSFIRLDNVSLSYNIPKSLLNKYLIQNMRITGTVRNVATFTPKWKNRWDPESGDPVGRTFSLGINFTL